MSNLEVLEQLSRYYYQFGIFTEDGIKEVEVNVVNTDDTTSKIKMPLSDVVFFTEYGTIKIPGQFILQKCLSHISILLNNELSKIVDDILEKNINVSELEKRLKDFALRTLDFIRAYINNIVKNNNKLGSIINEGKDSNKYLFDLKMLSKYIKIKLLKN